MPIAIMTNRIREVVLAFLAAGVTSGMAHAAYTDDIPSGYSVSALDLRTSQIAYSAATGTLWATVPGSAGFGVGNTLTSIDVASWTVDQRTFIGSEPGALAVSDDGVFVYAGLAGSNSIKRYNTLSGTVDLTIPLGSDAFAGPYFAEDIDVMPGSPETIAVSLRNQGFSPRHEGVAIYDGAQRRPSTTGDHTGANRIEFASSGLIYGYNNETSEFGLRTIAVGADGLSTTAVRGHLISGYGVDIKFDGGYIFSSSGRVIDPVSGVIEGIYDLCGGWCYSGALEPDSAAGVTYFASAAGLDVFDQATFTRISNFDLQGVSGEVKSLVSLGDGRLALSTSTDRVYLLTPVPEPETYALFVAGLGFISAWRRRAFAA